MCIPWPLINPPTRWRARKPCLSQLTCGGWSSVPAGLIHTQWYSDLFILRSSSCRGPPRVTTCGRGGLEARMFVIAQTHPVGACPSSVWRLPGSSTPRRGTGCLVGTDGLHQSNFVRLTLPFLLKRRSGVQCKRS